MYNIVAISAEEANKFGCPYCGYRSFFSHISDGSTTVCDCADEKCDRTYLVLAKQVAVSTIRVGNSYPRLQAHPRNGTPSHGTPDRRPEKGEFFISRGIGRDTTPGCFVCGGENGLHNNISGFVPCKAAGERVVKMFPHGARLDYREGEPDRVQVKIGACNTHLHKLKALHQITTTSGVITSEDIHMAKKAKAGRCPAN